MTNIAILGGFFGDESKGSFTHHFSKSDYDWVIRFSAGSNAGHTIYRDGVKFVHNLLPCVDWRVPTVKAYLGSGMVIDLVKLEEEILAAESAYVGVSGRIYVDLEAFIVQDKHKEEDKANNGHIGSTNHGIGPAYKDKIGRTGLRINDCLTHDLYGPIIKRMVERGVHFVHQLAMQPEMEKQSLLFEGAQSLLLDIDHGTYPYVSCGSASLAGIHSSGFGFAKLDHVYGVAKVYSTKVGEGPFPTEIFGKEAEDLRERGHEYGSTTGRPRRIGWLDLPALRYAVQKGNIDRLIITKFDILDGMEKVPVCYAYQKAPVCPADFFTAQPQYHQIDGWKDCKDIKQLREFLSCVKNYAGVPISHISRGIAEGDIVSL